MASTKLKLNLEIKDWIKLVNSKVLLTLDQCCQLIYKDILLYQNFLEKRYLNEFTETISREKFAQDFDSFADEQTEIIYEKMQKEVKQFSINYANKSIDLILDAINDKTLKNKNNCDIILIVLNTLKEINQ
jgi:hypothetical protein